MNIKGKDTKKEVYWLKGILAFVLVFNILGSQVNMEVFAKTATYTIAFYANGGQGSSYTQALQYNKITELVENRFSRVGYQFKGWSKKKDGAVEYKNRQSVKNLTTVGKTIKLYAVWKKRPVRRALVLGKTDGKACRIDDINNMTSMMENSTYFGEKMRSIEQYPNHSVAEIERKIKSTFRNTTADDVSYVYILCHGGRVKTNSKQEVSLSLGTDGQILMSQLSSWLSQNIKGKIAVFIQCCYSGGAIQVQSEDFSQSIIDELTTDYVMSQNGELASKRFRVLCSSSEEELSYSMGAIPGSWATCAWLKGSGWDPYTRTKTSLFADINQDKKVTLQELYEYSYKEVLNYRNGDQYVEHVQVYPKNSTFQAFGRY